MMARTDMRAGNAAGTRGAGRPGAIVLACFAFSGAVAPAHAADRFALTATARVEPGAQTQRGGRFALRGTLSSPAAAPAQAAAALAGGGYVMNAIASASSLVCYDDTIFRDDFDGDGF